MPEREMDPFQVFSHLDLSLLSRCRVQRDLTEITSIGDEASPRESGTARESVDRLWASVEALYRTGVHPAIQICIRRHGHVVLDRTIGHVSGNAPTDPPDAHKVVATNATPFNVYSAAKAVTAMVIHKLDEKRLIHLEDRIADFIPEFARHGKERISIRHILAHRAGIPNLSAESMDLGLLDQPDRIVEILCDAELQSRPGRLLAYHAVSGGFVLAEVVRRVTGDDIRTVLEREIVEPLGFRWMRYGVKPEDLDRVAKNAFTGPPVPPPMAQLLRRALSMGFKEAVDLSNDPRFLTAIIPSGNLVTTANEFSAFFQCLLDEGELDGVRVFDPRTIRHATSEQNHWEIDLTLAMPLRYGLGFMLGGEYLSPFGWGNPRAFGHIGFSNIFAWADPDRKIAVAFLTSGKPVLSTHVVRLIQLLVQINRTFPKVSADGSGNLRPSMPQPAPRARRGKGGSRGDGAVSQ